MPKELMRFGQVLVTSAAYSSCAQLIATGLSDGCLIIVNAQSGNIIRSVAFENVSVNAELQCAGFGICTKWTMARCRD